MKIGTNKLEDILDDKICEREKIKKDTENARIYFHENFKLIKIFKKVKNNFKLIHEYANWSKYEMDTIINIELEIINTARDVLVKGKDPKSYDLSKEESDINRTFFNYINQTTSFANQLYNIIAHKFGIKRQIDYFETRKRLSRRSPELAYEMDGWESSEERILFRKIRNSMVHSDSLFNISLSPGTYDLTYLIPFNKGTRDIVLSPYLGNTYINTIYAAVSFSKNMDK